GMKGSGAGRKLAAILAADVVGYSRLMQNDDQATLAALMGHRALFADKVATRGGRIVNAPGDSILAEFASVVDAVDCAQEIQRALSERNAGIPDAKRMQFRIGINVGDVLVDSAGAIYGDGVNIAARLESLAPPGGICVSKAVHDQVKSRLRLEFENLGERTVKNIEAPVHAFRVLPPGAAPTVQPAAPPNSIAVLPFDNLSGDPAREHFCEGISEDIITDLSKINGIPVIGRRSAFAYKGKTGDLRQVARELGVRYVMEGSVRTAGNRIRVTAQLIEAESGVHVWAQRYDRALDDTFLVGDEIAEEIVTALDVKLAHGEQARIWRKAVRSPQAREIYNRGLNLYHVGTPQDIRSARELFLEVARLQPDLPAGHGEAAVTHCLEVIHGWSGDPAQSLAEASRLGQKAVELDNDWPAGHAALGIVALFEDRHDDSLQRMERTLELRPMCAGPRAMLGYAQMYA
ncbi:MAG: adenylate/guanylate cyclase domain-containing protein, partial [Terriglobales bacterium]